MSRSNNGSSAKVLVLVIILALLGGALYISTSELFEKNPPQIKTSGEVYWNLKEPIVAEISDDSGIVNYKIFIQGDGERRLLKNEVLREPKKEILVNIDPPKIGFGRDSESYKFIIEATDSSKWNMLNGNSSSFEINIKIDTKRPILQTIASSYKIIKGGVALVIFKAEDENLDRLEIIQGDRRVEPFPFHKDGYYISLLSWSVTDENFDAKIVAMDKATNSTIVPINLFKKDKSYSSSDIVLKDSFIDGKITSLIEEIGAHEYLDSSKIEKFKFINEKIRAQNEEIIKKATTVESMELVGGDFKIEPFYPLKNSAAVASFGSYRTFSYEGERVSNSYHMGLDLASTQNADIISNNSGEVVFADFIGIYGNTIILHHGLGLHTLYSHCSQLNNTKGQQVSPNQVIAKSGITGLALGDHLHFGVVVNGIEVRPEEWMDEKWMDESIYSVMRTAIKFIDSKE